MKSVACLLLLALAVGICSGSSCPPKCKRKWCTHHAELNCAGNLVKDACLCCYVCAKQLNESCGGLWYAHGKCDVGLMCHYSYHIPPDHPPTFPGVCVKKPKCHVDGDIDQWIDIGQNVTMNNCREICMCKEDGILDCKRQEGTCHNKGQCGNCPCTEVEVSVVP